ncbi:MAG: DUF922 domain-containing protein [Bacteroidota bacterium]
MRFVIFFILTFFCLVSLAQEQSIDTVFWNSDIRLRQSDFLASPDTSSVELKDKKAVSSVEIVASGFWEQGLPNFTVRALFLRYESWFIETLYIDRILDHEQLHFDITELYARKIRCKIRELRRMKCKEVKIYISAIQELLEERLVFDKNYDRLTNHGRNFDVQMSWNENVKKELESLEKYILH